MRLPAIILCAFIPSAFAAYGYESRLWPDTIYVYDRENVDVDSLGRTYIVLEGDTIHTSFIPRVDFIHAGPLREEDFREIAKELDIETAAIKAVVDIETGKTRRGLNGPEFPVINFDQALFRRAAARRGISLARHSSSEALKSVNIRKYGSQQKAQKARLDAAMLIDSVAAMESTFWGMFQIGGFNWELSGAASRQEFMELMGRSEYDQLRLFANYVRNTGLLKYLKTKNWAAFARVYNGPSYAARGYHTRLAAAYRRHKKEEK